MGLWQRLRSVIYDWLIVSMTATWYRTVLRRLPENARVLDVGIGTATALVRNADLIREKKLTVVGIDIDADYLEQAKTVLHSSGLDRCVRVELVSATEFKGNQGEKFDAIYFSGSFMILPEKPRILRALSPLLADSESRFYFTQTFHYKGLGGLLAAAVKPILKLLLTIDFGQVTYEADFRGSLAAGNLEIVENEVIKRSLASSTRVVVARVKS
eukprot:TRINITY_DN10767_c0_g1_i1.p2 TRINITY_DN10767_c0_g1~~TRINITY_DN10767_c0_g1_i1.p2  ORF type:complete len:214 (+),score=37.22 TRINITY_DN10767_c0_g1_i1:730-1371(+)